MAAQLVRVSSESAGTPLRYHSAPTLIEPFIVPRTLREAVERLDGAGHAVFGPYLLSQLPRPL